MGARSGPGVGGLMPEEAGIYGCQICGHGEWNLAPLPLFKCHGQLVCANCYQVTTGKNVPVDARKYFPEEMLEP